MGERGGSSVFCLFSFVWDMLLSLFFLEEPSYTHGCVVYSDSITLPPRVRFVPSGLILNLFMDKFEGFSLLFYLSNCPRFVNDSWSCL